MLLSGSLADPEQVLENYGVELTELRLLENLDALIVAVGHNEYRNLSSAKLKSFFKSEESAILADLKSLYDKKKWKMPASRFSGCKDM